MVRPQPVEQKPQTIPVVASGVLPAGTCPRPNRPGSRRSSRVSRPSSRGPAIGGVGAATRGGRAVFMTAALPASSARDRAEEQGIARSTRRRSRRPAPGPPPPRPLPRSPETAPTTASAGRTTPPSDPEEPPEPGRPLQGPAEQPGRLPQRLRPDSSRRSRGRPPRTTAWPPTPAISAPATIGSETPRTPSRRRMPGPSRRPGSPGPWRARARRSCPRT